MVSSAYKSDCDTQILLAIYSLLFLVQAKFLLLQLWTVNRLQNTF